MIKSCLIAMASMAAFVVAGYVPIDVVEMGLQLVGAGLMTLACIEITKATRK